MKALSILPKAGPGRIGESHQPLQGSGGDPGKEQWFRGHRCGNVSYLSNKHCDGEEGDRTEETAPVQKGASGESQVFQQAKAARQKNCSS